MSQQPLPSDQLWLKVVKEGVEDRVEVNQRMLIDKMLARYSSDFVVYRELIQNSDDAQASSFTLQITCQPPTSHLTQRPASDSSSSSENDWHNTLITEIRTINNGSIFSEDDWKRVITIAEGNTNVDAIGQFGVGFFSVFSYSERPMIQSGKHCLAFVWQNGKSLTTFRKELSTEHQSLSTAIILPMKDKYILQIESELDNDNRSNKLKKDTAINEIIPTLDLTQLKAYFTKVLSFTKHINEIIIQINDLAVFHVTKTRKASSTIKLSLTSDEPNLLRLNSLTQTEQTFRIINGPSMTLNHVNVEATVVIKDEFHRQIQGVLKKSLPSQIHIEFLFPSNTVFDEEQWTSLTENHLHHQIFRRLIPLRFHDGKMCPSGQIFIGLATHQTTGLGMHVFTHLIPTIERENIDLQDPYVSIWNEQLLTSIGNIVRLIYDQIMLETINTESEQTIAHLKTILSSYAFQRSAPNEAIGRIIVDGFFSSDKEILVPVQRSSSDHHLSLIPSSEAYLSTSKHVETFLPIPLVPFDLGQTDFFRMLKRRGQIREIDHATIAAKVRESILFFDELVGLLRWLCTIDTSDRSFIKDILSEIYYRETDQSAIIQFDKIEFYDTLNIPSLPLPWNVLPSNVVSHLSRDDLHRRLGLSGVFVRNLIEFYFLREQQHLFENETTSRILLSFLSQRWAQFSGSESSKIKSGLAKLKCIPTSQGMKSPADAYIPSSNLADNLPIVTLYLPQISSDDAQEFTESPVSVEFLKAIGCRTMQVPATSYYLSSRSTSASDNGQALEGFIRDLLEKRKTMSDSDLQALRNSPCLIGTTLENTSGFTRKYKPSELHFPSVAEQLQWTQLPIIDWMNINPLSAEYSLLRELGVREVPDLHDLIFRVAHEHYRGPRTNSDYQLPHALVYFAEHFRQHYWRSWENARARTAFLPSLPPEMISSTEVILTTPDMVFREPGPLCPSLLPEVLRCFSHCFDISLLGVKYRPQLETAFDIMIDKRHQLLTVETVPACFSYLNKLDGLNKAFIQKASTRSFIPLPDTTSYFKPSQVFLRSNGSSPNQPVNDMATAGLIDYVDFGPEANSFLLRLGVQMYPSAESLADLLIERHASYFAPSKENTEEVLVAKLRVYTNCLKQLAAVPNIAQQFHVEPLRSRLINRPWCLAYQIIERADGMKERTFKIARPAEVYLDDDHQSAIDLRPMCAPDEPELTQLYALFGSKWLSEAVKRTLVHRGDHFTTDRSEELHALIHHRLDMLFVNNRGQYLDNIDEKRIESLRTHLSVYEAEGIQCQLSFEYRTITLSSTDCSSCVLEYGNDDVSLFIHKDIPSLDYIDIAAELTRFVHRKPLDALVHSISDKLASPLETLKRRGIPVDRLLKTVQPQSMKLTSRVEQSKTKPSSEYQERSERSYRPEAPIELLGSKLGQSQKKDRTSNGFLEGLKDVSSPIRHLPNMPLNSIENVTSQVTSERIYHFGRHQSSSTADIATMLRTSRPYTHTEFTRSEYSRHEINDLCEYVPAANMHRHDTLLYGISLYVDQNVTVTKLMIELGKHLAWLLSGLAKDVFRLPVSVIHLFRDVDSARIAFNNNGALFFNLRYFEQVYADDLRDHLPNASSSIPIVRAIVNFYFIIACHELAHNIDSNHNLNFINRFERVLGQFMDAKEAFLSTFSFQ